MKRDSRMMITLALCIAISAVLAGSALAQTDTAGAPTHGKAVKEGKVDTSARANGNKLEQAIAMTPKGTAKGQIDNAAPRGFLGIPGGPRPFWLYCILWGTWVGWVFSSVGAFGGIMAGVGHISVFGLGDYASSFKKNSDSLGKLLTDSIRTSNQYLVGLSGLISSLTYYKMGRLVLPLAVAMGLGAMAGGYAVASLSAGKVDTSLYVGAFGVIVLVIGGVLFYETTPRGQAGKKAAKQAAAAFEKEHIAGNASSYDTGAQGVCLTGWSITRVTFTFYGVEFGFNPIIALIGGFVINGVSAFIGVGGGFLYVPFLTTLVGLPM